MAQVLAGRLVDYWWIVLRRTWQGGVISSFLTPLLYVLAMGVLLGGFIEGDPETLDGATSYLAFVAPGLLASQVMVTVFGETTWPVLGSIKFDRTYLAMIATPLRVRDVVLGHLGFCLVRVAIVAAVFVLVLVPFGVFASWWGAVAAFAVQLLVGAAFAGPVYAITVRALSEAVNNLLFRIVMMPLFLFSGAFFPVDNLPQPLEALARVTPLWHGVDLTRMLTTAPSPQDLDGARLLVHVAYLAAVAGIGLWAAVRQLERRLSV
jgi:lipooligosaccharide transport system permease protein